MKKQLFLAAALFLGSTVAMANHHMGHQASTKQCVPGSKQCQACAKQCKCPHKGKKHKKQGAHVLKSWKRSLKAPKNITKNEARTLAQAAIILYGDKGMQVKSVQASKDAHGNARYDIKVSSPGSNDMLWLSLDPNTGKMHQHSKNHHTQAKQ